MAMTPELKKGLLLFKEYCEAFDLRPTTDGNVLEPWTEARGQMVAGAFLPPDSHVDLPPIAWVTPEGTIVIEQDEDLLQPDEPAVAIIEEDLIRVAINNKRPIHPIAAIEMTGTDP